MLNEDQIREIIAATNPKFGGITQDKNARFDELGLDSLDRYEILVGVQEATGIEVPDDDVEKLYSIAAIEAYFSNK